MRHFLASLSIRKKLTLLMFFNAVLILGMMSLFFFLNELYFFRQNILNELSAIARITAQNAAFHLFFHDRDDGEKLLNSFTAEPGIRKAAIYTAQGELFAVYHAPGESEKPEEKKLHSLMQKEYKGNLEGIPLSDEKYDVFESIRFEGKELGTLYICGGMDRFYQGMGIYLRTVLSAFFLFCLTAWILSSFLQTVFARSVPEFRDMLRKAGTADESADIMKKTSPPEEENAEHVCKSAVYPLHVLVAEDNQVNLFIAKKMLENMVCTVATASNGEEVLEMVRSFSFDLIFMDCQMPIMDGYTATAEIRKFETGLRPPRHTVIIALTAHSSPEDRKLCLDAGMDDYLAKPVQPDVLEAAVNRWSSVLHKGKNTGKKEPENSRQDFYADADISEDALTEKKAGAENISPLPAQSLSDDEMPPVDNARLDNIRSLQQEGKADILKKVIGYYLEHTPKIFDEMEKAVTENNAHAIVETAHSLKSSSGNVGAMQLFEMCREMEATGKNGQSEERQENAQALFASMQAEFKKVKAYLETEIR